MKIKSKISKKISALLLAMTLTLGLGIVAYAATFGDDLSRFRVTCSCVRE